MSTSAPAVFSDDRVYRYSLYRPVDLSFGQGTLVGILCNPSKADETRDDPTIRRWLGFARRWGFRDTFIVNLFAFRATDPKDMMAAHNPVGPDNDDSILLHATEADRVVCAWGNRGAHLQRSSWVRALLQEVDLYYLRLNGTGEPEHPLYIPGTTMPRLWTP